MSEPKSTHTHTHRLAHTYADTHTRTHSSPSQGHAVLVNSKIKSEHHVQRQSVTEITFTATGTLMGLYI